MTEVFPIRPAMGAFTIRIGHVEGRRLDLRLGRLDLRVRLLDGGRGLVPLGGGLIEHRLGGIGLLRQGRLAVEGDLLLLQRGVGGCELGLGAAPGSRSPGPGRRRRAPARSGRALHPSRRSFPRKMRRSRETLRHAPSARPAAGPPRCRRNAPGRSRPGARPAPRRPREREGSAPGRKPALPGASGRPPAGKSRWRDGIGWRARQSGRRFQDRCWRTRAMSCPAYPPWSPAAAAGSWISGALDGRHPAFGVAPARGTGNRRMR